MNNFGKIIRTLSAAFAATAVVAAAEVGSGKFTRVVGNVTVEAKPVQMGDIVNVGSTVVAGEQSKARIFIGLNGPELLVHENGRLTIEQLALDRSGPEPIANTRVRVNAGKAEAQINRPSAASSYILLTPTVTAAIRSTLVTGYASGRLVVWDGSVEVTWTNPANGQSMTFNVSEGQTFDPTVPGVIETPADEPPPELGNRKFGQYRVKLPELPNDFDEPVGPLVLFSPVK